jgi:predicted RNA-binding protein Jag
MLIAMDQAQRFMKNIMTKIDIMATITLMPTRMSTTIKKTTPSNVPL